MLTKASTVIVALAMLIALTGVVMADCASGSQGLTAFDSNLGSVSDNVVSHIVAQCDGNLITHYSYVGQTSNGRMNAPIVQNQTMFQTGYEENTLATGGVTSYSNNVTVGAPTVAGQDTSLSTDRNVLFEGDNNGGTVMTDEGTFTAQYGTFPMNGSKEALIEGGSVTGNHFALFNSQFIADNIALSSQNDVISGTIDRPSSILGADPDLITLDSTIAAQGHSTGFSQLHAFSHDQTGLGNSTVVGTDESYSDSVSLTGNFAVLKDFHWALKSKPTIQTLPVTTTCLF